MKVTDLKENEVIHCETLEQYDAICQLLHEAGLRWNGGREYIEDIDDTFANFECQTCINPISGMRSKLSYNLKRLRKIHPATDFITPPQTKEEYAKERAIGFALWLQESDYQTVDDDAWCDMVFTTKYTTAELYDEYLKACCKHRIEQLKQTK